jgi:Calx-beta domain/PKD domain
MRLKTNRGLIIPIATACWLGYHLSAPKDLGIREATTTLRREVQKTASPTLPERLARVNQPARRNPETDTNSDPLFRFDSWSSEYLQASETEKAALVFQGTQLAQDRRPVFKELIKADPKTALERAVPMVVRQKLPLEVLALLEKRVNEPGTLELRLGVPGSGVGSNADVVKQRLAQFEDGRALNAHVYGRRKVEATVRSASINGVSLDSEMAVNELPSRRMEVGEVPPSDKKALVDCPVSGKQVFESPQEITEVITPTTPAVETGDRVVFFCDGAHIVSYNDALLLGEGATGGAFGYTGILPNSPTPSLGVIKVLVIPMTFADQNTVPATEATLYETLRNVSDHYSKASYGRLTLVGTVTPLVKLPHNEAWYVNRDTSNGGDISGTSREHQHARDEARKMGYDSNEYDSICVRHEGGPGSYGGLATVPGNTVWLRTDSAGTWAHEIGHSFGLLHANFWETSGTSSIGPGGNDEYGHPYDIVGTSPSFPNGHFNVAGKNQIRWLTDAYVQTVTQSGVYRIHAQDTGVMDPTRRYAMRLVKDAQRTYWGELRSLFDTIPWIKNGLMLGWRYPNADGQNLQLLDTTPGSPFLKEDAPISLGSTFSDTESGIHLTTVAMTENPRSVDVQVHFGSFAGNQKPTLSLAASATSVPVNGSVTFTATAADADNDALAYSWQHFGDTSFKSVAANAPVMTRQFTVAGTYVVSCTVSDMKGGTSTRSQLITVGNGNGRFTIRGRVVEGTQGLADVVVTANGINGVITDADGYYVIPNLTATTYAVTPLLYGYTFEESFNNPVVVGPSFVGANFRAVAQPVVTITAPVASANELVPVTPGTFRLTRVGDTSGNLLVNVNSAQGSATKGTDYNFTPDYVGASLGFSTFTIPAGSATLDITLTPLTDTNQEGPETATLQLGPGNGYIVNTPSTATIVIEDDDTALPKVSITATANRTLEAVSPAPAVFTLTRSGSTAAALTVNYSVSGSATSGTDFTALTGSVTIPANAASAVLNVLPLNDAVSESQETLRLTLTANAAYLIDPLLTNATVNLDDDDQQSVSLSVTDATAQELDLSIANTQADTGTFVVTRSGDTSAALTVFYAFSGVQGTGIMALHGIDFEALPGSVVIPAGQTQASITVVPRFDQLGEGPEQAVLHLGAAASNYVVTGSSNATVTINDGAADQPYIDVTTISNATEGSGTATFRLTVRGGTGTGALVVNYAFTGTAVAGDFSVSGTSNTLTGTSITLNNGATVTKDITITATNDVDAEDLETLVLTLGAGSYKTYSETAAATMWLRDNDNVNTVYVTPQVGTSGSITTTEGDGVTPVRFYVSRTGSTSAALVVGYAMSGTATSGSDYVALTGNVTIAAGSLGANVDLTITNDTTFEGTETIVFDFAAGGYSRGPGATIFLGDNDAAPATVAFSQPSSSGLESVTGVNIPVTLSAAQAGPVTVQYQAGSSTGSGTTSTVAPHALPFWVRVVKSGNSITHFESNDGANWTQRGSSFTVSGLGNDYLAGLAFASASSTTAGTATFDNFSISGLSGGGALGTETAANLGNAGPGGTHTLVSGVYNFNNTGSSISTVSSNDNFRFVYTPVSTSADCVVTARIVSCSTTSSSSRLGVMLRSSTAQGSVYAASLATGATPSLFYTLNRTATNGNSNSPTTLNTPVLPQWFRVTRTGDLFTNEYSTNGTAWTAIGTAQTLAPGPRMLVGLAVSAMSDGSLATGVFDNVTLDAAPVTTLRGRTVGFTDESGSESLSGGVWTLTGSGAGINGNSDEAHFAATEVSGNFAFTARLISLSDIGAIAQAGVMTRQTRDGYSRQLHAGFVKSGSIERRMRMQTTTNAYGSGIDFTLAPGTLAFAAGETVKNILLNVNDDKVDEPDNIVTLQLLNPTAAGLGTLTVHGYTIEDDDGPLGGPYVSFAAASSGVVEDASTGSLVVSLSYPATAATSIDYSVTGGTATSGTDFTLASGTLSFAAGETVKVIPFTVNDDSSVESSETFTVTLATPSGLQLGSNSTHTVTITDNDQPVITITANDAAASEAGDAGQFTLTRTGDLTGTLTVNLTLSGTATNTTDYATLPLTAQFAANASTATINVTPVNDATNEGSETVILTLASGSYVIGTPNAATVTISDDDRSIVSIAANDAVASETPGNPGQFTLTRTAPITSTLAVTIALSGSATNTTDYTTVSTTVNFTANSATAVVNITPVNDTAIEGEELVTVTVASGSTYDIGTPSFATVSIADNDEAPSLYISSPGLQSTLVTSGNGIILQAVISDDGLPAAVTQTWTQISGPSAAVIESPASTTTAVTFADPGSYAFRITATDTQFTVTDEVTIAVGSGMTAADWITQDFSPATARRGQSISYNGLFTVTGTGAGYASTSNDQAHVMTRQATGDGSITARLTALNVSTALSGITMRDAMLRGSRRAVLGYIPGTGLQFRARTASGNDALVATQTGLSLPLWLKLDRNDTTDAVIASYAPDVAGSPGTWIQLGATTTIMDTQAHYGLTTTSNSTSSLATGTFDNVTLTPAPVGAALLSEDASTAPAAAGSGSLAAGTYTIIGSTTGYYHGWQYTGDMVVTCRLATFSSGAGSALGGIRVTESMDGSVGFAHFGRMPTSAFDGYLWQNFAGGSSSGLPTGVSAGNWIRLIRKGTNITGFRAPDASGSPGAWIQIGQPQTVIMSAPVFVGFFVNNNSGVGLNTVTFSNLTVQSLNKAPIVGIANVATWPINPIVLDGTITDDTYPVPASLTSTWSKVSGPGSVTFGNPALTDTTATLSQEGSYVTRLIADDTLARSFRDLSFTGYLNAFQVWQAQNWSSTGGTGDPNAAQLLDPDFDGQMNLLEYAFGTAPKANNNSPILFDTTTVTTQNYLRITVPKNPAATDVTFTVEASSDLVNWSSAGLIIEANTSTQLRVRDNIPFATGIRRFMRVKVTRP